MITIIRGTDNSIKLNFTENGEPFDITDYSILFTVKAECKIGKDDNEALITKNITVHSNPEEGESTLNLSSDDTDVPAGQYYKFETYGNGRVDLISSCYYQLL